MPIDWKPFAHIVKQHQRFSLTSHIRPDCDALGSELGLAMILEAMGKTVTIVNGQKTPSNLEFIDPDKRIQTFNETIQPQQLDSIEVAIILDTSAWVQLGSVADWLKQTSAKKVLIDHHLGEDDLGAVMFKDTSAEATGRLIVDAAEALGVKLTATIAMPLFAALATDTGWFRFGSAREVAFFAGAKLVAAGASPSQIYGDLYEQETIGRVKLRGVVLARTELECEGKLVHTFIRLDDFKATGALPSDTEDLINLTLAIKGTQFAVIFVELTPGKYKISFRSRCSLDCSQIAQKFQGGGHKAAAGGYIDGEIKQVQEQVLGYVRSLIC
jgi:bifunctional oligoribonuclease and PAP phosphatase NrnA